MCKNSTSLFNAWRKDLFPKNRPNEIADCMVHQLKGSSSLSSIGVPAHSVGNVIISWRWLPNMYPEYPVPMVASVSQGLPANRIKILQRPWAQFWVPTAVPISPLLIPEEQHSRQAQTQNWEAAASTSTQSCALSDDFEDEEGRLRRGYTTYVAPVLGFGGSNKKWKISLVVKNGAMPSRSAKLFGDAVEDITTGKWNTRLESGEKAAKRLRLLLIALADYETPKSSTLVQEIVRLRRTEERLGCNDSDSYKRCGQYTCFTCQT